MARSFALTTPAMPSTPAPDDYDSPWKAALEHAFPEFVAFHFADAHARIDWMRGYTFLDKELQQIAHDAPTGRRHVDKLARVFGRDGSEEWVCIHIEIQGQHDAAFAERMFVYNYRIYDRHRRPVASLAVLADNDPTWRPDRFAFELFGCRHSLHYPVAKLTDLTADLDALLANPNPFALVAAAHHLTRHTRHRPARRFDAKRRLVRLLYERDWSRTRILDFFAVLDWMMQLPRELETELWHDIERIEGERKVKYVTSVERLAIERGLQKGLEQGLEQGLERGREQGLAQGLERGRQRGGAAVLARQLNRRFAPLSPAVTERLAQASPEQLESWAERILDATSIDDVFAAQ